MGQFRADGYSEDAFHFTRVQYFIFNTKKKNLSDQQENFKIKKQELETKIQEIKDEIQSLIHFQNVRKEIEEEERSLAEKVEQQRIKYEERLDQLEERERADFVRMKKDMIQRVNLAATDFRKTSDQQVPPTIKRAIRENQQVQSALKKMEINCNGNCAFYCNDTFIRLLRSEIRNISF